MDDKEQNEEAPAKRSVDQLRGIEGVRVRETYKLIAQRYGVSWNARRYDPDAWAAVSANLKDQIGGEWGDYVVKLARFLRVVSGPTKIAVAAGSTTIADYIVDSGIRTAVPQD